MEKNIKYRQNVEWLKACGKSIIDNAETIAGGYLYQTGDLDVTITINDTEVPVIRVQQELLPELMVEQAKKGIHER